jgi:hypothetical protein
MNPTPFELQEPNKFEVTKPKMGDVMQLNKDTYIVVVGGKPNGSWTGVEKPRDLAEVTAYQHRPTLTNESTKTREPTESRDETNPMKAALERLRSLLKR